MPKLNEEGSVREVLRSLRRTAARTVHGARAGAGSGHGTLAGRRFHRRDGRKERPTEQIRRLTEDNRRLREQNSRLRRLREQNRQLRQEKRELRSSVPASARPPGYNHDCLAVWEKDVAFLQDPAFLRAYLRGMDSGHHIVRAKGSNADIHVEWRVHVACWAGSHAKQLPGHFVECGVNTGIFSLAVCDYIDFNATGKDFFLFDTFAGIPPEQAAAEERDDVLKANEAAYDECYELARRNFAPFPRARLVRGRVPDTLATVAIDEVCYLSIDMNIAEPEIAAIEFFWDRLAPGAPVLLDDYGWSLHARQRERMDEFALSRGVTIANLPTGQGLLLKP